MKLLIILSTLLLTSSLNSLYAAEFELWGTVYTDNCQKYQKTQAKMLITYINESLPEGAIVEVKYGFEKMELTWPPLPWTKWVDETTEQMKKLDDPGVWQMTVEKATHTLEDDSYLLKAMDFVFIIKTQDGKSLNESDSLFYRARLDMAPPCMKSKDGVYRTDTETMYEMYVEESPF